jgi:hypothetical protein
MHQDISSDMHMKPLRNISIDTKSLWDMVREILRERNGTQIVVLVGINKGS